MKQETAATQSTGSSSFRSFLQNEFVTRCRNNRNYSLRSFARSLKLSPAALSEMLNGKRTITSKTKERVALMLQLTPQELSRIETASPTTTTGALQYEQLTLDAFAVVADWYHFAILELLAVKGFKSDPKWIATTLGISPTEAQIAVERLLRLKLLNQDEKGRLKDSTTGYTSSLSKGMTSEAAMRFQSQIFIKAAEAIAEVPLQLRDHTGMTFAINTRDLPRARKRIESLRRELDELFRATGDFDEVYHLSVGLFPLTKNYRSRK